MSRLRASVDRRIRVLIVRRRLEEHAASLVELITGQRPLRHRIVARRLMLLTAHRSSEQWHAAHSLARRAADVYAATSTVLHSNRAFGDVSEHLVQEWERVAADLARAIQERPPHSCR